MTNLVQLNYDDLQAALKSCLREAINEFRELPTQPEKPDKIDFPEALKHCGERGIKISESKGRKMCMDGKMPCIGRFGRRLVFSRKMLDKWLDEQTIPHQQLDSVGTAVQLSARKKL
jgi:hypothetical protein